MKKETFTLEFDQNYFNEGDLIQTSSCKNLEIVSSPKPHYFKWYWRVLNKVTFGKYFNASYSYKIKNQLGI